MKNITGVMAEPGIQEILIGRELEAPRGSIFKACTDPDLYVQWMGPGGLISKLEISEPLNGGSW